MMCPEPHGNTNFVKDTAVKLRNTGRYEFREENGKFTIYKKEKKPLREKYWWAISLGTLFLGWTGDLGKGAIQSKWNQPLSKDSTQSKSTIQVIHDTVYIHYNDSLNLEKLPKRIDTSALKLNPVDNKKVKE